MLFDDPDIVVIMRQFMNLTPSADTANSCVTNDCNSHLILVITTFYFSCLFYLPLVMTSSSSVKISNRLRNKGQRIS